MSKGVARGSRDHFWKFWDPLHISATAEGKNSKFGMQNDREVRYRKKMKIWVKRGHRLSRDHFGEFLDPLNISATVEARNLKLGMQNDC